MTAFAAYLEATASHAAARPAVANRSVAGNASPAANSPVARGDLRSVEPLPWTEGRRRLALVRGIDAERETAEVILVHPYPELATGTDAVLADRNSGILHPLVVECYVRNSVWLHQLGKKSGELTEAQLEAINRAVVYGDVSVEGLHVGLPLAGFADPRQRFKKQEVQELHQLASDCNAALLSEDAPWPLKAERLSPANYAGASDESLAKTIHLLATRPVSPVLDDLDPESLDPARWIEACGADLSLIASRSLQPAIDRALARAGAAA